VNLDWSTQSILNREENWLNSQTEANAHQNSGANSGQGENSGRRRLYRPNINRFNLNIGQGNNVILINVISTI